MGLTQKRFKRVPCDFKERRANPMFKYQKRVILRLFLTKECYNKGEVGKQCKKNLYECKSMAYNTVPDNYAGAIVVFLHRLR